MKLIPNSNNIARITGILGVKKTTEYFFIGTGFALVALGSVCYLITAIKSHGRIKEQNDVFANKQMWFTITLLIHLKVILNVPFPAIFTVRKRMAHWQMVQGVAMKQQVNGL